MSEKTSGNVRILGIEDYVYWPAGARPLVRRPISIRFDYANPEPQTIVRRGPVHTPESIAALFDDHCYVDDHYSLGGEYISAYSGSRSISRL